MGYDALNLGRRELNYGLKYLQKKASQLRLPFISANLVEKKSAKPIFNPYIIKEFGGSTTLGLRRGTIKIGIFGVAATVAGRSMSLEDKQQVELLDPITAAEQVVAKLRRKCDMVIGMGNMQMQEARRLVKQVKGIDLFIVSGNMRRLYKPELVKQTGTLLLKSAYRGKRVGELLLTFDVKQRKVKEYSGRLVSIDDKIPKDEKIDLIVKQATRKAASAAAKQRASRNLPPVLRPRFVGSDACVKCHKDVYDRWKKTRHAKALATLAALHKDSDPACFRCHTTGYTVSGGYLNRKQTPNLTNVRCEACHGPGSMHLDNSRIRLRIPTLAACLECHTPKRSRPLNWEKDKKLVH